MGRTWLFLLLVCFLIFIPSCGKAATPVLSSNSKQTSKPLATLSAIDNTPTLQKPTWTLTLEASDTVTFSPTSTSTPIPETATPEPFLPFDLALIVPENVANLQKLGEIPVEEIYAISFSASGEKLATLSERWQDRSRYLEAWDLVSGKQLLFLDQLKNPWETFFSADETQLFVFYPRKNLDIYDLEQQVLLESQEMGADRIDFSPDRKSLATGDILGIGDESVLKTIDLASNIEGFSLTTTGMLMRIGFSPDGRFLTAGVQRGNHFHDYVWEISSNELKTDIIDNQYGLTFSPDSELAALSNGQTINILSTHTWALRYSYTFSDPYRNAKPKSFSLDGNILVFEDRNNLVFIQSDTGRELTSLPSECDARFSPNGKYLLTWCYQGALRIWGVVYSGQGN